MDSKRKKKENECRGTVKNITKQKTIRNATCKTVLGIVSVSI